MLAALRSHPGITSTIGTVTGWASVDLLRAAQIFAGLTAGLVSLCMLIIIAPKVCAQLAAWWAARPWSSR